MRSEHAFAKVSLLVGTLLASVSCQYAPDDADAEVPESTGEAQLALTALRLELSGINAGPIGSFSTAPGVVQVSMKSNPTSVLVGYIQGMLGTPASKNGAVVTSDGKNDARRLEFTNAFLT